MPEDAIISEGNVCLLRRQRLGQLAFVYDRLFKEESRGYVPAAWKRIARAVGICEITTINEEIATLAQDMV
jgi:hypothetical protein